MFYLPYSKRQGKKEREREAQPSTLLTTRGSEKDIMNYILQRRMCTQEKEL
jgi:hypothetical protein